MKWSTYDAFDKPNNWPGHQWEISKQNGQETWDRETVVLNPGGPDNSLTIRIPQYTLLMPPYHGKAMMLSTERFAPEDGGIFAVRTDMAVEIYGTDPNPFGVAPGDPRLANGALVILDEKTGVVLDFLVTNDHIFAVYERLPYARAGLGHYPTFTSFLPTGVKTCAGEWHNYEIHYDRATDTAEWRVDGVSVARHSPVGAAIGRTDPVVKLDGMRIGGALFTMMDGGVPIDSDFGDIRPLDSLVDRGGNDLFGQGGQIAFREFSIGSG